MSDRTEEEEERYIRRVARRMPVDPCELADCLKPHGFILTYANRNEGINDIRLIRASPLLDGLFDTIAVGSNIHGDIPYVNAGVLIAPGAYGKVGFSDFVPATNYGYLRDDDGPRKPREGRQFCTRLAEATPAIFSQLYATKGQPFHALTADARAAAERYLEHIRPTSDLEETLVRMNSQTTDLQQKHIRQYMNRETASFGRTICEIVLHCHVQLWDRSPESCLGKVNYRQEQSDEIEAQRRIQIASSRLARTPGWPLHDPLVPNRRLDDDSKPWREGKPSLAGELFDEHLAAEAKRCECGRPYWYLSHLIDTKTNPPVAIVIVRCNAGHEASIELAWNTRGK